jgi:polyisoprenoid-binding protein YceI
VTDDDATTPAAPRRRYVKWIIIGAVGLVALVFGGILLYAYVLNDSPDELDAGDLSDALVADVSETVPETAPATVADTVSDSVAGSVVTPPTTIETVPAATTTGTGGDFDGDWLPTDASEFGYRVDEVIAGVSSTAVGRSNEVSGLLTIDGTTATAVDVEVQIDSIKSDSALRDGRFTGSIMNSDEFPTATFSLTEPIEFGTIPTGDEQVTATATGELTLRGVTNPVTFDVTAQTTDGRIGVFGSIPVVFADYGIDNPSFGQVRTEDDGLVEFVLVFEHSA